MNLRILKKLARAARPLIVEIAKKQNRTVSIFDGFYDETPVGSVGKIDLKHYERSATRYQGSSVLGMRGDDGILIKARKPGRKCQFVRLRPPFGTLAGTPGHEWRCCHEVPEYDCEDLYSFLLSIVSDHFTAADFNERGMTVRYKPNLSNPTRVFKLAKQIISEVPA
jgi:hypothetical protein